MLHSVESGLDASARTVEQAVAEIQRLSGTQFDPAIVDAFNQLNFYQLADGLPSGPSEVIPEISGNGTKPPSGVARAGPPDREPTENAAMVTGPAGAKRNGALPTTARTAITG